MIVSLTGIVRRTAGMMVVIDVAGVGYLVHVTPAHALALRIGDTVSINTVQIVREDSLSLFGFATDDERDVFELLLGVTGVGPKSALGVLSALSPADIADAVAREDDAVFRKVSGIGPKTAKLIVVSLSGKVLAVAGVRATALPASVNDAVIAALTGLGWPEKQAVAAVESTAADADAQTAASVPALLRATLTTLGGVR
ncbi:MAG: Holliday junction branch migration protein RuvA [Agromyces sp.]